MTIENWRKRWLISINELTDYELQKKSWLDATNKNPHWSFVEFNCVYFDEILADYSYDHYLEIGWIDGDEYEIIFLWHDELDKYVAPDGDHYDNELILKDKNWQEIVQIGLEAKEMLIERIGQDEIAFLSDKIKYP